LSNSDILVIKTDALDPMRVRNNITFPITITNNGPDPATGVTFTDTLSAGRRYFLADESSRIPDDNAQLNARAK
jgi:uncharacterized repeat protein (TIGR01451 family)